MWEYTEGDRSGEGRYVNILSRDSYEHSDSKANT